MKLTVSVQPRESLGPGYEFTVRTFHDVGEGPEKVLEKHLWLSAEGINEHEIDRLLEVAGEAVKDAIAAGALERLLNLDRAIDVREQQTLVNYVAAREAGIYAIYLAEDLDPGDAIRLERTTDPSIAVYAWATARRYSSLHNTGGEMAGRARRTLEKGRIYQYRPGGDTEHFAAHKLPFPAALKRGG